MSNHTFSEPQCEHKVAWNTCVDCRPTLAPKNTFDETHSEDCNGCTAGCCGCLKHQPPTKQETVNEELDLILGLAPLGTLKGDRTQQIKDLFAKHLTFAKREGAEEEREKKEENINFILEIIYKGYTKALGENNHEEANGYAHCAAIVKMLLNNSKSQQALAEAKANFKKII